MLVSWAASRPPITIWLSERQKNMKKRPVPYSATTVMNSVPGVSKRRRAGQISASRIRPSTTS
jgi:hypothetical protein